MRDLKTRLSPRPPCALSLPSPCADRAGPCSSLSLGLSLQTNCGRGWALSVLLRSVFANARPRSSFALSLQTRCGLGCALGPPSPLACSPYFATCRGPLAGPDSSPAALPCLLPPASPPAPCRPPSARPPRCSPGWLAALAACCCLPAARPLPRRCFCGGGGSIVKLSLPGRSADDGAPAFCVKMRTACAWARRRLRITGRPSSCPPPCPCRRPAGRPSSCPRPCRGPALAPRAHADKASCCRGPALAPRAHAE